LFGEHGDGIAVVGMAGRFPGARDLSEFWNNLCAGIMSLTPLADDELRRAGVPQETLADPDYVKVAGLLDGIDRFEPALFGITPREAESMDPQMRVLLEISHDALHDAGYDPYRFGGRIGMYAGARSNQYLTRYVRANPRFMEAIGEPRARIGNYPDYLSSRVSYHLGLRGPAITSVTACSTSLVTVHMACLALLNDECDIAVAGGVEIPLPAYRGYKHSEGGGILAADGVVRPFDAQASGMVFGAGVGVAVLKRLSTAVADRDAIHAVILGSAVNNDGGGKSGYAAPSAAGQGEVLASALRIAGIDPMTVGYVEGHGTGAPAGDPVEVAALNQVYGAGRRGTRDVALGSVKGNVGHPGAASGICGLIKAVYSVREGVIPASLNFSAPNPGLNLDAGPFYVADRTAPWPRGAGPLRAAVSAFGIGGTNAHLILEEPPAVQTGPARPYQLLTFSARTLGALSGMEAALRFHLSDPGATDGARELADVAYTLAEGRPARAARSIVVAADPAEVVRQLGAERAGSAHSVPRGRTARVVFLMPGQGAEYVGMARQLYRHEPEFAADLDHCRAALLRSHGLDIASVLFPAPGEAVTWAGTMIGRTSVAQPALFAVEYALARLLISWGMEPAALAGHGTGEYAAAALAGVMDADDALRLTADLGRLTEPLPRGANVPSRAFHSRMVDPALEAFADRLAAVHLQAPRVPFVSSVTGDWITTEQAIDQAYWVRQVHGSVRFADAAGLLLAEGGYCFAEVGPGSALSKLVNETAAASPAARQSSPALAVPLLPAAGDGRDDLRVLLQGVGRLWAHGCPVNWRRFWAHEERGRVHLPAYPYERESFWVNPVSGEPGDADVPRAASPEAPRDEGPLYVPTWTETGPPRASAADDASPWVMFAHPEEAVTSELIRLARDKGVSVVVVSPGSKYAHQADGNRAVRPREAADYAKLAAAVLAAGPGRVRLVHAWLLGGGPARTDQVFARRHLDLGLYSLLLTLQEFSRRAAGTAIDVSVLTSGMQDVLGDGDIHPAKAAVRGLIRTVPREIRNVAIRGVDVGAGRAQTVAAQLFLELRSGSTEREVALRGRKRWVARYSVIRPAETTGKPSALKEEGVYVITGGLGGLGLELAKELARQARARIVLVGRSGLPPRSAWAALAAGSPEKALREQLRGVLAVEEAGGQVFVCTGDVADEARMRQVRAEVMSAHGRVDGLFHLAGAAGGGLVEVREQEAVERVLAPKVLGTYVLDRVFRPSLLVLYSSLTAVTGDYGQSDYAGANAFLDAYAQAQWASGRHVVSVNWPQWTGVGMASRADDTMLDAYRESAITPAEAAKVLRTILVSGAGPQVVVSPGGLLQRAKLTRQAAARAGRAGVGGAEVTIPGAGLAARYVETPHAPPRNGVEQKLAVLWQQAVGMEQVGLDDDFRELGISSIMTMRLVGRISEAFGVQVSARQLFEWRTLRVTTAAVQAALKNH
jgi:acyl transferase domain-containing protein/acyl carrier protein